MHVCIHIHMDLFVVCSDYGYAKPGEDLSGLCVRDPDVELEDPCANRNTTSYLASTGSVLQCIYTLVVYS